MNKQIEEVVERMSADLVDELVAADIITSPAHAHKANDIIKKSVLVSELRAAREALERITYYASDCGRRECTCNQCEIVRILEKQNG